MGFKRKPYLFCILLSESQFSVQVRFLRGQGVFLKYQKVSSNSFKDCRLSLLRLSIHEGKLNLLRKFVENCLFT